MTSNGSSSEARRFRYAKASSRRTSARSASRVIARFSWMVLIASRLFSMNTQKSAPRLRASIPTPPVPANRSSHHRPRMRAVPTRLNTFSLIRSRIGRVASPGTDLSLRPFAVPDMTRMIGSLDRHAAGVARRHFDDRPPTPDSLDIGAGRVTHRDRGVGFDAGLLVGFQRPQILPLSLRPFVEVNGDACVVDEHQHRICVVGDNTGRHVEYQRALRRLLIGIADTKLLHCDAGPDQHGGQDDGCQRDMCKYRHNGFG